MENTHSLSGHTNQVLSPANDCKIEEELYSSSEPSYQTLQNVPNLTADNTNFTLTPINVKEEISDANLDSSTIRFQHGNVPVMGSTSHIKVNSNVLGTNIPIVSQGMQLNASGGVLMNANETNQKVFVTSPSVLSLGQAVQNCIPITQDTSITSSAASSNNHPVQIIQQPLENCGNVLNQPHPGSQTYILTSTGNVIPSQVSQGQVFIQGDELLNVNLSTSTSNSPSYSIANSESQYINTIPMVLGGTQAMGGQMQRLILQPNQTSPNLNNQIISSNGGHYFIQMGQTLSPAAQNKVLLNQKGHIVIKAGTSKIKDENSQSSVKDGVFRVVIPEGTTKLPKFTHPMQIIESNDDVIRKHVQINLSNRAAVPVPEDPLMIDSSSQALKNPQENEIVPQEASRKLYECPHCNSKFIRPLYLRMHMRNCNKPEVKAEKTPLLMCSFCKATFKTKPMIEDHFPKCSQRLNMEKENSAKREQEELLDMRPSNKRAKVLEPDLSLDAAILYKCQDCDRTFSKERQYTSHVKRCTKVSVHDMSGVKAESAVNSVTEDDIDVGEDPFADLPLPQPAATRKSKGGGGPGRRGRPPGKLSTSIPKLTPANDVLFEGDEVMYSSRGLVVADNDNLVRSTTGLAHTVQMSLDNIKTEGVPWPAALVTDYKGVHGRNKVPQTWSLVCSLCQKMFMTKAALASHVIECHGQDLRSTKNTLLGQVPDQKLYKCPLCLLHYQSGDNFLEHLLVQHTLKLQNLYKYLQTQTATFVCSLCSLVLLTKDMLMEHLSLEHLDHLEKLHHSATRSAMLRKRKLSQVLTKISPNGEVSHGAEEANAEGPSEDYYLDLKPNELGKYECGLCSEEFLTSDQMIQHYNQAHDVEVSSDGILKDLSIDVDIRVKNTSDLIRLADGKVVDPNSTLPSKTVLLRKKPKQNWKCPRCQQVFTKQVSWLRHMRETCQSSSPAPDPPQTRTPGRESHFMCNDPECRLLSFFQVKSLFKHLEVVHKIVVPKERRSFANLGEFQQWLNLEEETKRVRFVKENTRVEKNNVRLIQMVCHRFQLAKAEQSKDKDEPDLTSKPSKKRWTSRVQRANFCHARIHLRVDMNPISNEYDWETQMIYYPQHSHESEDCLESFERIRERYPRDKLLGTSVNKNAAYLIEADSASSFSLDSPSGDFQIKDSNVDNACLQDQSMITASNRIQDHSMIAAQNNVAAASSAPLQMSSLLVPSQQTHAVILPHNTDKSMIFGDTASPAMLTDTTEDGRYIVMGTAPERAQEAAVPQEFSEEYVLPADESEWTKLFGVLSERLTSGEMTPEERKEAESLLAYQNLIPVINITEQVSIFQRMCSITNTSLESV